MLCLKVTSDQRAVGLGRTEVSPEIADHFLSVQRTGSTDRVGLDILIEVFVGVELGTVAWQEIDAQLLTTGLEPAERSPGQMHRMVVDDQEDSAPVPTQESAQEFQEHGHRKTLLEHHELQLPAVGEGRNEIAAEPLACAQNHWRLALRTEGTSGGVVPAQAHFVRPENQRLLPAGQGANSRILAPQPRADLLGVLLEGPASGLLRREAPLGQQPSGRPNRKTHPTALGDQMHHRFPRPQIKRQLQLIRAMVGDKSANGSLLFGLEPPAHRTPPPPGAQPRNSGLLLAVDPTMNGLAGNPEKSGHLRLGTPFLERGHRLDAEGFLCLRCQRAEILMRHAQKLS